MTPGAAGGELDGSKGLFGDGPYDLDDEAADAEYERVDAFMSGRRKRTREAARRAEADAARAVRPRITEQFADLKSGLASMSESEWDAIPESSDGALRMQARRQDQFMPVPDTLIQSAAGLASGQYATQDQGAGATSAVTGLSQARGQVMALQLDRKSDSVDGQTVVDPAGYLTGLDTVEGMSEAEVGDVKKGRALMKSMIASNPGNPLAWVSAARFEEHCRKLGAARHIINKATEACPKSEDVWLEAARLAQASEAPMVLANAVRHIPRSVKVWLKAASLERELPRKRAVLRQGLEFIPSSVKLWKAAVELEEPEDAKIMLQQAVGEVPGSAELWISLARLETHERARGVLNKASKALPTEPLIRIAAAKLEEAAGNTQNVSRIIGKSVARLASKGVIVDRATWIAHATQAEQDGSPLVAASLIQATLAMGVDALDQKRTWLQDAAEFAKRGHVACARAAYDMLVRNHPSAPAVWLAATELERNEDNQVRLSALLEQAVKACPAEEVLWLIAAKQKWRSGDAPGARAVLKAAFDANPNSEAIWLAAVKLEQDSGSLALAKQLLVRARANCHTARVWMKSALLARDSGDGEEEISLLRQAVKAFPDAFKCWLMLSQAYERQGQLDKARAALAAATKSCTTSPQLWQAAAAMEAKHGSVPKARSILDAARSALPDSDSVWEASVRLEDASGSAELAESLLAKGHQACPKSGRLWALSIERAGPKHLKQRLLKDAMAATQSKDPLVLVQGARFLWATGKPDKAQKWLARATSLQPLLGDAWAWRLLLAKGWQGGESPSDVVRAAEAAAPTHGSLFAAVAKSPSNHGKPLQDVLEQVAAALEQPK